MPSGRCCCFCPVEQGQGSLQQVPDLLHHEFRWALFLASTQQHIRKLRLLKWCTGLAVNFNFLKSTSFLDITPCSPLKANRRFGGAYSACHLLLRWYLARLIRPWRWKRYVPPKRRLAFSGVHGVISQKIVLFITTAVGFDWWMDLLTTYRSYYK
jgi:hypothetical protein